MKKILFFLLVSVWSCKYGDGKIKESQIAAIEPNLYDIFYLELLSQNRNYRPINIDSLEVVNVKDELFEYLSLDSVSRQDLKDKSKMDIPLFKIQVSDSIKKKVNHSSRKLEVIDFFSKPLRLSNTKTIIFFETHHKLGYSDGVVFYSKELKSNWRVDSLKVLNNYRGGSRLYK
jgi:hypothetical protein